MSTVTVTTSSDASINDGTAASIAVTNTGGYAVFIKPWMRKMRPGERVEFTPEGQAVTARADTGTTTLDVVTTAAAVTDIEHLAQGALQLIEATNTVATSGSTVTLPAVTTATLNDITLSAACTVTLPAARSGSSFTLVLRQDGTGSRAVTWGSTVKWPGGVAPTLSTAAGAVDVFTFICPQTTWLGFIAGQAMA